MLQQAGAEALELWSPFSPLTQIYIMAEDQKTEYPGTWIYHGYTVQCINQKQSVLYILTENPLTTERLTVNANYCYETKEKLVAAIALNSLILPKEPAHGN